MRRGKVGQEVLGIHRGARHVLAGMTFRVLEAIVPRRHGSAARAKRKDA